MTMTPSFTKSEQAAFFEGLGQRTDYHIWGVQLDGSSLIGAAGLKNPRGALVEYWGYIGEKCHWGKGFGRHLVEIVEEKAKELGYSKLDLKVSVGNQRAIALYKNSGFIERTDGSSDRYIYMLKEHIE